MKRTKPFIKKIIKLNNSNIILQQNNRDAIQYLQKNPDKFIGIEVSENGATRITGITNSGQPRTEVINKHSVQLNFYHVGSNSCVSKVIHFSNNESLEKGIDKIYQFVDNSCTNKFSWKRLFN